MLKVCEKHSLQPVQGYSSCPGCEIEYLRTELIKARQKIKELKSELKIPLGFAVKTIPGYQTGSNIWVKDKSHPHYVSKKDRGIWATQEEASEHVTESWEIVVEV
jgi:hypothetical protein